MLGRAPEALADEMTNREVFGALWHPLFGNRLEISSDIDQCLTDVCRYPSGTGRYPSGIGRCLFDKQNLSLLEDRWVPGIGRFIDDV